MSARPAMPAVLPGRGTQINTRLSDSVSAEW